MDLEDPNASHDSLVEDYHRGNLPYFDVINDDTHYSCLQLVRDKFAFPERYRPLYFVDLRYYPYPFC